MNTLTICIISFLLGVILSALYFLLKKNHLEKKYLLIKTKLDVMQKLHNLVKEDFTQIASQTIKTEQEDLRKQHRETLEEKLKPLEKELNEFKSKVELFNVSGVENTAKIITQLNNLEKNNRIIEQEARNLTEALTKNQNIKGAYGEDLLEIVLQNCGMQENIHYYKQFVTSAINLKDDTEHNIRPDIIINLPDNRHIIIDSKFTLSSYIEYVNDNSKLKEFKNAVKARITELAKKNYPNAQGIHQPDFILMYMPLDSAVTLVYTDLELINFAYKSNIIIANTASLLTVIRLVQQLLSSKKQTENIQQIISAGTNLYDTFVAFCYDLLDLQKKMEGISQQFTTTINRFGRTNKNNPSLFSQIKALREFGINSSKKIPDVFLEDMKMTVGEVYNDDKNIDY